MTRIFAAVFFLVVSATGVLAGFVPNYSDWKLKSPLAKMQYAMGLLDGQLMPSSDDNAGIAKSHGLDKCALEIGLTGVMIADAITSFYESHTDMWGSSPMLAFHEQIARRACLLHINIERAKYGLLPWKKP